MRASEARLLAGSTTALVPCRVGTLEHLEPRLLMSGYTLQDLAAFDTSYGSYPETGLVMDGSGNLYGTTTAGGYMGAGTVFEVASGSGVITTLASFDGTDGLQSNVIKDGSGNLYGTTLQGGASGDGSVFEVVKGSGTITTLASFNGANGARPFAGLIMDDGGNLYGTTESGGDSYGGTLFEVVRGSSTITPLASFNPSTGEGSEAPLVMDAGGNIYGTTLRGGASGDGTVFELAYGSGIITPLASFASTDGLNRPAGLIVDGSGNLYGTTPSGGGYGDVFKVANGSGVITPLALFDYTNGSDPMAGLVVDDGGNLYGTTTGGGAHGHGTLFEVDPDTGIIDTLASFDQTNGGQPQCSLLMDSGGNLYGTTVAGGANNAGTAFEVAYGSGTITTLATFNFGTGTNPAAGLIKDSSGNLYGTTSAGGDNGNQGAVFEVANGSGTITTLASFNGADGSNPQAGLFMDGSGNLYGTTRSGGADDLGTVFEVANGSGTITTLASFDGVNGSHPLAGLVMDGSGNLFGTTYDGGADNDGTVFEVANSSGTITDLASFNGTNGSGPFAGLFMDGSGNLYGTTSAGGDSGEGAVFEVAHDSGTITLRASFNGTNGSYPVAGLIVDGSGNLYGTTRYGGDYTYGTVFEVAHDSGAITDLVSFDGPNGSYPCGGLIRDGSGNLLGTTSGGGDAGGDGIVFEVANGSGTITDLVSFNGTNGSNPLAGLIADGSGNLYGTTGNGGANGYGAIFKLSPPPTVSGVSPSQGPLAGGTMLTITGTNLAAAVGVMFGSTESSYLTVVSATEILAMIPAGVAGTVHVRVMTAVGDSATSTADQYTYVAAPIAPAVTSVSPNTGPQAGGTAVTITGTNLSSTTSVYFGASPAASFVVLSDTQIQAVSPVGAGPVDITVTTTDGTSAITSADRFTYVAAPIAPAVTSVSPNTGPLAGGTTVTITGSNLAGATAVKFGTQAATIVSATATQIVALSPAGVGTVDVTVTTTAGTSSSSSADRFTYVTAPSVTSVSPNTGPLAGGTTVTITGSNLAGATAVKFGTQAAIIVSATATQIVVTSPAGGSGTVDVTVTTAGGTSPASPADPFTYVAAPTVASVGPNAGPLAPGTPVTITGANLLGATSVKFGTLSASITNVTATQIVVVAPGGASGTVDVTVMTAGGTSSTSSADQFTYLAASAAPTVASISANKGLLTGGTTVTITGTNLLGATAVNFGLASATIVSDAMNAIEVISPAGVVGTVDVTVVTAAGTSHTSSADKFTYIVAPTVASVSANTGPLAGGTTVTIKGTNLLGATGVNFGMEAATIVSATATQIVVKSPAWEAGTVDVTVEMAGGTSFTSSADQFTYVAVPTVTAISPASGPLAGGTMVTITGMDLLVATAVNFGTKAGTIVLDTGTQIVVKSPAGAAGAVDVTVTTGGGISSTSLADQFTYLAAPTVASVSPNKGPLAGGTSVTITGTNLANAAAVNFGAVSATILSDTDTQIVVTSPAGDVGAVDVKVVTAGGTSAVASGDKFTYFGTRRVAVKSLGTSTGSPAGGTTVTIKGIRLLGATAVNFGTALATIVSDTATQIVAISPAGVAGMVDITVTTADGTSFTSSVDQFTYGGEPTVTAVSPGSGPKAAGTLVTITGANLLGATAVHFGTALATIVMDTDTEMLVKSPAGAAGTVDVTVAVGGATSSTSSGDRFTYLAAPTVAKVSANYGPLAGGTTVTITGTNLLGATAVSFGPATAAILSNTGTQIVVTNPACAVGVVDVRVVTAGGISGASGSDRFTYVAVPTYPAGVLSASYLAQTQAQYNSGNYSDSQFASSYSELPLTSTMGYGDVDSGQSDVGTAKGFYDAAGKIHYTLEAMGVNSSGIVISGPSGGTGQMTLTQQNVISSATAGKPDGASINASGTMTLTGSWEATRAAAGTDVGGLESSLELTLNLLRPNMPSSTIFDGSILLAHQTSGGNWVSAQLVGQMAEVASVRNAVAAGFSDNAAHTDARISLAGIQIPYKLPVDVGEAFTIQVIMKTYAFVPAGLTAGAQVAMGQPLQPMYYLSPIHPG
jgi:uncharacterized repeat protein (TIGR03803 family)